MIICRGGGLRGGGVRPVVMQALRRGALVMGHYREGAAGRGKGLVSHEGEGNNGGVGRVGEGNGGLEVLGCGGQSGNARRPLGGMW